MVYKTSSNLTWALNAQKAIGFSKGSQSAFEAYSFQSKLTGKCKNVTTKFCCSNYATATPTSRQAFA